MRSVDGGRFRYTTPTEPGSSGSPVFNAVLQLIGIHHARKPGRGEADIIGEGISMRAIVSRMREQSG
jgi:V8-like Glu-specific endopeptidase